MIAFPIRCFVRESHCDVLGGLEEGDLVVEYWDFGVWRRGVGLST